MSDDENSNGTLIFLPMTIRHALLFGKEKMLDGEVDCGDRLDPLKVW